MRDLDSETAALLMSGCAAMVLTASVDLDAGALRLNSTRYTFTYAGRTYLGAGEMGGVGDVVGAPGEMPRVAFSFSGVSSANVAMVLSEKVRGRAVEVGLLIVDPETGVTRHHQVIYAGIGDVMSLDIGDNKAEVTLETESGVRDLLRASGYLYSHAHQQQLNPGDMSLQFVSGQVEQAIVWPAKEYFQR
jgi:hypothetical protein